MRFACLHVPAPLLDVIHFGPGIFEFCAGLSFAAFELRALFVELGLAFCELCLGGGKLLFARFQLLFACGKLFPALRDCLHPR